MTEQNLHPPQAALMSLIRAEDDAITQIMDAARSMINDINAQTALHYVLLTEIERLDAVKADPNVTRSDQFIAAASQLGLAITLRKTAELWNQQEEGQEL